jgi:predicted nucleic acid-binding protein
LRDPDDELILELAMQCDAMIVTHNARDFAAARKFGVSVLDPPEALAMLKETK